jgi:3-phenylpropionate/trans-cinnamate dioxygenase ferredoxin reductase component
MSSDAPDSIVIIGAGECGARTTLALREQGFAGSVTLLGSEAHLPYERPPLSKDVLTGEDDPSRREIASEQQLVEAGIIFLHSSSAESIDRVSKMIVLGDGTTLAYDKLLLATGASPRRLPMAEGSRHTVYLRTYDDAVAIRAHLTARKSVAIIGGGFIGLEIAASARKLGCEVTIIEGLERILMRGVPAEIAAAIHAEHESHGVRLLTSTGISSIEDQGDFARITLAGGETIEAGLIIVGIGAVPNTALAQSSGLDIDNGISVDGRLRTSDPAIWAAGDCASFPAALYDGKRIRLEAWRNTHDQAKVVAANMLGGNETLATVPWFWSDQYDLGLQVAGLASEGATTIRRDVGDGAFILFSLAADGRLVAASGIGPGNSVARDIRIAEMLISKRAHPDPAQLAAPETKLKALLAA